MASDVRTLSSIHRLSVASFLLGLTLVSPGQLDAAAFSSIFVFGDSFSDMGNVFAKTQGFIPPDPPYFQGRFTDGPVWVERLAERLDLPLTPNGDDPDTILGNNFAAGGARAATDIEVPPLGTIPSLVRQTEGFVEAAASAPTDGLFVVYAGYNDLLIAADPSQELDSLAREQIVLDAVGGVSDSIRQLTGHGATQFLVPNLADVGATPDARFVSNNAALASSLTVLFNAALASELDQLQATHDIHLFRLDTFTLTRQVIDDATNDGGNTFGITNVDVPIFEGAAGSPGADPRTSLFADTIHVSAAAHRLLGDAAFAAVPEPAGAWLLLLGLLALSHSGRVARRFN